MAPNIKQGDQPSSGYKKTLRQNPSIKDPINTPGKAKRRMLPRFLLNT